VCKILSRSVEIRQYEGQKLFLSKNRVWSRLCLGLAVNNDSGNGAGSFENNRALRTICKQLCQINKLLSRNKPDNKYIHARSRCHLPAGFSHRRRHQLSPLLCSAMSLSFILSLLVVNKYRLESMYNKAK